MRSRAQAVPCHPCSPASILVGRASPHTSHELVPTKMFRDASSPRRLRRGASASMSPKSLPVVAGVIGDPVGKNEVLHGERDHIPYKYTVCT